MVFPAREVPHLDVAACDAFVQEFECHLTFIRCHEEIKKMYIKHSDNDSGRERSCALEP